MHKSITLSLTPKKASDESLYIRDVARELNVSTHDISSIQVVRRSIDARKRDIKINLALEVYLGEAPQSPIQNDFKYQDVTGKAPVIIIGAGPAGLFAALRLIELGLKPIVFERGKDVSSRKKDIAAIHRDGFVNADSNYGYGEGGAGTFSDGKLYTRSKKRGNVRRILEILNIHGAQDEVLIDVHPHIGTNVLPKVITEIREKIINCGGEVHFNARMTGFIKKDDKIEGIKLQNGDTFHSKAIILATGHSARDIYDLLDREQIALEAKSFAVGVRLEHSQHLIDSIQYHRDGRGEYLPPAAYSMKKQVNDRGVYSFCMCPGGVIVPAATSNDELVVNGMSPSSRGGRFANSGLVVEVRTEDLQGYEQYGHLAGLRFQQQLEQLCFRQAGNSQIAPAQRMTDFVKGKFSQKLNESSYRPGIQSSEMHEWLPEHVSSRLRQGFELMGRSARGFLTEEATVIGVESRTSSPVRIPRDRESFEHPQISGLFPCGEGAGFAGGIVSSAIDGELCAEKVFEKLR